MTSTFADTSTDRQTQESGARRALTPAGRAEIAIPPGRASRSEVPTASPAFVRAVRDTDVPRRSASTKQDRAAAVSTWHREAATGQGDLPGRECVARGDRVLAAVL